MAELPILDRAQKLVEELRSSVVQSTVSLFDHADYPLEHTLDYKGDPGLAGPGSVSWHVIGDVAAFVGGMRGLLIQAAHPEVVAGVGDHSRYRSDPFGRLSRTSAYVTATTFGAMPEVEKAAGLVRRIHKKVKGVSSRGIPYDAEDPGFSAWVHNALTDSFLTAHQTYGGERLSEVEADQFVMEQTKVGALLGADPMPKSAAELTDWVTNHPEAGSSPEMEDVMEFLSDPPLTIGVKAGYKVLFEAAVVTIPERLRDILGVSPKPGAHQAGKAAVSGLRWALGYSPSWAIALKRMDAELPEGLFQDRSGDRRVAS